MSSLTKSVESSARIPFELDAYTGARRDGSPVIAADALRIYSMPFDTLIRVAGDVTHDREIGFGLTRWPMVTLRADRTLTYGTGDQTYRSQPLEIGVTYHLQIDARGLTVSEA